LYGFLKEKFLLCNHFSNNEAVMTEANTNSREENDTMKIGIDPGHGGEDPGAVGQKGLKEKDVNLGVALELVKLLENNGFDVVITRRDDSFIELRTRSNLLNMADCAVAVSVHVNSSTDVKANYISTFIQSPGGKAEVLAGLVQQYLAETTRWPDGGVRQKNLHMTRETKMPAVLVELGFISNPDQEKWLKNLENRKKLSGDLFKGIYQYFMGRAYPGEEIKVAGFEGPAKVVFRGKEIPAGILEGKTYVELRTLAEMLGLNVAWDNANKTVTLA